MDKESPVYLLSYDHAGYVFWGVHFAERIESAKEWLDKYPSFKIGIDNEAFTYDQYAIEAPEIMDKIREILSQYKGRFGIGVSTYGQPLSVFVNEESNVRQLTYAIKSNIKHFGIIPPVYAISEHALHNQIPQLIKQAGYKMAIMRTHFMMYGYNPTFDAPIGHWVGEDGTGIPTIPTYSEQGADFAITTFDNWVLTRWPEQTEQSLEHFAEKFSHIKPLLASRYDDAVLRCEKLVEHTEGNQNYQWVILEDLIDIYPEPKEKLLTSSNDFIVRMPWGYWGNRIWNDCRKAEAEVLLAERLNTASYLTGGASLQDDLERAWKNALIAQHHDIQICGLMKEAQQFTKESIRLSNQVAEKSMQHLSSHFYTSERNNILIFNPHGWEMKQWIEAEVTLERGKGADGFEAVCADEHIPCSADMISERHGKTFRGLVRFEAAIPPMTLKCYKIQPCEHSVKREPSISYDKASGLLTTNKYEMKLDSHGIRSIKRKDGNVVYVDGQTGSLFEGVINGKISKGEGKWLVHIKEDMARAIHYGEIEGIFYTFTMIVHGNDDRIDCHVKFLHNGEKIGTIQSFQEFKDNTNGFVHENKLRFILNTTIKENAVGIRDLPFTVSETEDKYIQGNYWTALSDGVKGIAYFNRGAMCAVREEDGRLSLPLAYANEYVWGAHYLYGEYEHEFSILPFDAPWNEAEIHQKAYAYQYPCPFYLFGKNEDGKVQDEIRLFDLDKDSNLIISALYPENEAVILRCYEYEGKAGSLRLAGDYAKVDKIVTIMGEETEEQTGQPIQLKPHEIKSVRLIKR